MDFDLSDEQRLLKESVERLLADDYGFEQRKGHRKGEKGYSSAVWARFAELGLLGLPFAEEDGGFGGGPVETMLVMEAFGRSLVVEPYLATVVLGGGLIRRAGDAAQRARLLPAIADGSLTLALAQTERHSRYDLHDVAATARREGAGYVIDGEKAVVLAGDHADEFIVTARTSGARRDEQGIGLFLVPANAPGVTRRGMPGQDGARVAEVTFTNVAVSAGGVLGDPANGLPVLAHVIDEARAALCAEGVGCMAAALDMTVEYLKTRKQFGVPIGSFQVLQHRASEMFVALEQARSMAMFAAMASGDGDAATRGPAISAAKAQLGRSAKFVGESAIQLHGGIGMTMEYAVGHYFKRLTMIDRCFGDEAFHLARVAEAGGLQ